MKQTAKLEQLCREQGIPYTVEASLKEHCTFKIGGPADLLVEPSAEQEIRAVAALARKEEVPLLVLGKGSNILFADEGYRGAVLLLGNRFSNIRLEDETAIRCQSGASLMQLCLFAWEHGLSGLEFAFGIPGSVGGAVYMNAGAYGGEMKDVLVSASHIHPEQGSGFFAGEELELAYRHSAYSDSDYIITGATVKLQPGDKTEIRARMDDFMNRRKTKQPLEFPSAGSTFRRPEGSYASALIDQCGLKGKSVGGAQVSEKHAGFVINRGGATCADVRELIRQIQAEVKGQTGFALEPEVKLFR